MPAMTNRITKIQHNTENNVTKMNNTKIKNDVYIKPPL